MSNLRVGLMRGLVPALAAAALVAACGGNDDVASRQLRQTAAEDGVGNPHDPCTLLSAGEIEPYIGALVSPPYRSSDGAADTRGDECMYRGTNGRELTVRPDWSGGGASAGSVAEGAAIGMDTLAHRVVKAEATGPWDKATWIPGGSLLASRGNRSVQIDVSGSSGRESDAVALATIIMPRFDHPLRYDGAKAVALAPKPRPHPANACDLISRVDVEAAIGPLDGMPTSDSPETSCAWRVASEQGERIYIVEFQWEGGGKNYQMLKHGMATVSGVMGLPSSSPLDTMKPPPGMEAAVGGMMKMMGGATLQGPWDNAALLHGTQLIAVRHDVFVGIGLQSADYEKARSLLAAICSRL